MDAPHFHGKHYIRYIFSFFVIYLNLNFLFLYFDIIPNRILINSPESNFDNTHYKSYVRKAHQIAHFGVDGSIFTCEQYKRKISNKNSPPSYSEIYCSTYRKDQKNWTSIDIGFKKGELGIITCSTLYVNSSIIIRY